MTSIVKAVDAAQFLSLVPRMFGFTPVRSVVVVPFAGGRSAGGMRVDLPPGEHVDGVAATLVGMVCRVEGADACMVVVYDDAEPGSDTIGRRLIDALRRRADACGVQLLDALQVGPDSWRSTLDRRTRGAVAELAEPDGVGEPPQGDQRSGAELDPVPAEACAEVAAAFGELSHALHALAGAPQPGSSGAARERLDPAAITAAGLLDDLPVFFDDCVAGADVDADGPTRPDAPEPYRQAALIWCLTRPSLRDIGLVTWLGGVRAGDAAVEGQLGWEDGDEYPADLAAWMWGEGPRPDADRLLTALGCCRRAASLAPPAHRAGPLAACAWLSWALGRLTHAESYARRACEDEARHGLATIVLTFVAAGHLPDWAFRR